ncbi:hypothetical protein HNP88_000821 [Methanococcus maripaludis]|uniref:Helicase C-terminal domain-containing protein n=1 Tax=Methanococcus maripaludis TaxID=39152 RepID=A0A7J9NMD4_METMI|nr:DISARM system helicase DrmA [Methanococcus maripaludis]MBA2846637.1 hypothetical protein [Methanococcus maripaludis]
MRRELISEMIMEVYGPRPKKTSDLLDSEEEILKIPDPTEIVDYDPLREYITGAIIPAKCKNTFFMEENDTKSEISESESSDEIKMPSLGVELDPKLRPQSFGISFISNSENPEIELCATWARYSKKGDKWIRKPEIIPIKTIFEPGTKQIYEENDGNISLHFKRLKRGNKYILIIHMLNNLNSRPDCYGDELTACTIFQPSLRINLKEDEFSNMDFGKIMDSEEDRTLNYLYRDKKVLARGHMCSTVWKDIDPVKTMSGGYIEPEILWIDGVHFKETGKIDEETYLKFMAPTLRTDFVPVFSIPAPLFDWPEEYNDLKPELSAEKLSEMWDINEIDSCLEPLKKSYGRWITKNESEFSNDNENTDIVGKIIENQKKCLERLETGINLLKTDENARLAFCFANKVINLQYEWSSPAKEFKWRPFQLAFFLTNLESVYNENSKYRDMVDLMWVPTGGGKTEAYLALIAFLIASRRRKGIVDDEPTVGAGTSVLIRYTLRLLTIQQFRRTLKMVTLAEYLRIMENSCSRGWKPKKCSIESSWIYGSPKFSIGMWVGGAVTPNKICDSIDALERKNSNGDPAQVTTCPICGTPLAVNKGVSEFKLVLTFKNPNNDGVVDNSISKLNKYLIPNSKDGFVKKISKITDENFVILDMDLYFQDELKEEDFGKIRKAVSGMELLCSDVSRPGYFINGGTKNRKDFEIYCPNPGCNLNNNVDFKEGVPYNFENSETSGDGLYMPGADRYAFYGNRMPIPAYTVDDQVYHRCPTVLVCTVDKFAQLAFEPRSAAIFGNVKNYSVDYGYYRSEVPKNSAKNWNNPKNNVEVDPFRPPELIIQDELHLIEGPIGSMYGLYENAIDSLIKSGNIMPKYIVSTATIKNADYQIKQLYSRNYFQFPPYGSTIDDSFFVRSLDKKYIWNEDKAGRVYLGIYAPSMGPHTPNIRIVSRLISSVNFRKNYQKYINFKTLVWYFNAIRELGSGRALYREDIIEHLKNSFNMPNWEPENSVELSSITDSLEIPTLLTGLENEGNSSCPSENKDVMFTTSMFGTGVDISHLSTILVGGQPKTTSQYIQATGRVGRSVGGLSLVFLRAGRPRDLSHYELFPAYHQRIYLDVEPCSVSPYSKGCMDKAMGPVLVSYLRNKHNSHVEWDGTDGKVILKNGAEDDYEEFISCLSSKTIKPENWSEFENHIKSQWETWHNYAEGLSKEELVFNEKYNPKKSPEKNVVLGTSAHEYKGKKIVFKKAPYSLRDVEESIILGV